MNKKSLLNFWLLLLCMIVGSGTAWADDVTIGVGKNDITWTADGSNYVATSGDITLRYEKGTYSNALSGGLQNTELRLYSGTNFVISSTNTITKIVYNVADGSGKNYSVSALSTADGNLVNGIWTGSANSISASLSAQNRIKSVTVTYTGAPKTNPTITFSNGSVRVGKTLDLSTLFESNSDGAVTYSITAGDSYASLDGSILTGVAEGSVEVKAEQAAAGNYNAGEASATITVNAALTLNSIAITTAPTKTTYTEGETFDPTGMVVTATYSDSSTGDVTASCTYTPSTSTALTTSDTEITVSYTENAVEKTTTQAITVNALPSYNVTWSVNGATTVVSYKKGATINFPEDPEGISGTVFMGWAAAAIDGTTDEAPEYVTSATMSDSDITFYAVFAKVTPGTQNEVTDVLTRETTGVTSTTYTNWSGKSVKSDAVYAGNSAGDKSSIQLRSSNSNSGIVSTTSGGKVSKIAVTWNSSTSSGRVLDVYGSNTASAISSPSNLYNYNDKITKVGSITCETSTELVVTGDYTYVGLRSNSGAMYLTNVSITWVTGTPDTYSSYCTTVVAAAVEQPVITVAENPFLFSTTATITCATDGAAIMYSYDGENWDDYSEALTITETKTIYAKATKNEYESAVAQVTVTKNLAMPTVTIDASGITNTNVYEGTDAGSLAAAVTYNEEAVEGAVVSWSGNNDEVATIDAETGAVTLVGAGSVTFTATYAGNGDYSEKTATYVMTVTNSDPNAPGTENNPYTVAQARAAIDEGTDLDGKYVHGIISQVESYSSSYKSITYWISDDGTTTSQIKVYSGKGLDNTDFSAKSDLQEGDIVTVYGDLLLYSSTYEINYNNYITSLTRKAEPELAYETTACETFPADDEFVAPTLTNPHDLTVTYSSSDEDVALVDENTGEIALGDVEGAATITATFAGNEAYKAGNASYTITLTKLEAGLAYAETEFEVRVGKSFTAPTLTNPNSLTVTYSSSDEDVALVDENTGEVVVGEAGEATITATFAGNTKFNAAAVSYTLTVISGKLNPELTVTESVSMNARTTKAITGLYTVTSTGAVTFESSDETVAAVVEGVLETYKNGTAMITVNVAETEDYDVASADIAVTVTALPDVPAFNPAAAGGFVKVTATEDIVDGDYLIVYEDEDESVAFNGSLGTLDKESNVINVEINDGRITESKETSAAVFTIDVANGTLMSASGKYIGVSSNSNGLKQADDASIYKNSFAIDDKGNAVISAVFEGSTMTLRFNTASNQNRFRYYKSGQQDIQLYRHQSASLTIGSTGWRTLVASENVQFPEGLTAYIVSSKDDNTAYLKKVSAVKANVPVLLKGEKGSYTLNVVDETACDNTDSNLLCVSETGTYENVFVLANKSNGVGFYKWTGGWMGAGRVYLPVEPEAGARGFISFNTDGETTGIAEINSNNVNVENAVYDLQGRKVKEPKKGLYIINGAKVFIK